MLGRGALDRSPFVAMLFFSEPVLPDANENREGCGLERAPVRFAERLHLTYN
jgi:hypothetical protein